MKQQNVIKFWDVVSKEYTGFENPASLGRDPDCSTLAQKAYIVRVYNPMIDKYGDLCISAYSRQAAASKVNRLTKSMKSLLGINVGQVKLIITSITQCVKGGKKNVKKEN